MEEGSLGFRGSRASQGLRIKIQNFRLCICAYFHAEISNLIQLACRHNILLFDAGLDRCRLPL